MMIERDKVSLQGWHNENIVQTFNGTGQLDENGHEIGYIVGFNDNGEHFAAWVQKGRRNLKTREFFDFGPRQRARYFDSQSSAQLWAYSTLRERMQEFRKAA